MEQGLRYKCMGHGDVSIKCFHFLLCQLARDIVFVDFKENTDNYKTSKCIWIGCTGLTLLTHSLQWI